MKPQTENRKLPRLPEQFQLKVQKIAYPLVNAPGHSGITRDISGSGIRFYFDHTFPPKTLIRLEMHLIGWQRYKKNVVSVIDDSAAIAPLTAVAEVVWARPRKDQAGYEIGVRFMDIYQDDYLALNQFLDNLIE